MSTEVLPISNKIVRTCSKCNAIVRPYWKKASYKYVWRCTECKKKHGDFKSDDEFPHDYFPRNILKADPSQNSENVAPARPREIRDDESSDDDQRPISNSSISRWKKRKIERSESSSDLDSNCPSRNVPNVSNSASFSSSSSCVDDKPKRVFMKRSRSSVSESREKTGNAENAVCPQNPIDHVRIKKEIDVEPELLIVDDYVPNYKDSLDDFIVLCDHFARKIEKREKLPSNQFILVLRIKNKVLGENFKRLLELCQQSAAIPNEATLPNIEIIIEYEPISLRNNYGFVFEDQEFDRETDQQNDDSLEELFKKVFRDPIRSISPFFQYRGVLCNSYGPLKHKFRFIAEKHRKGGHNSTRKAIEKVANSNGSFVFTDIQLAVQAILYAKYCPRCLVSVLRGLRSSNSRLIHNILDAIWTPKEGGKRKSIEWIDDNGMLFVCQEYRRECETQTSR